MCGRGVDEIDFTGLHETVTEVELKEALWRALRDLGNAADLWRAQSVSQVHLIIYHAHKSTEASTPST
jgi:hypothetical protein